MSPLEFRASAESTPPRYPGFAIPAKPPREGFPTGTRRNLSYAARAKLSLAVKTFPSVLPGSRRPGHAATASLTPSKPVAPVTCNLVDSRQESTCSSVENWSLARLVKRCTHMVWLNHLHAISTCSLRLV